ncbi:methyltransferase domain-containing protein [bacterium]|nr:methyltransferase domain-containing protein [bacterium]
MKSAHKQLTDSSSRSPDDYTRLLVARAYGSIDRSLFVSRQYWQLADKDVALPIGFSQTISKPSTVIKMLLLGKIREGMRVLEVGAGCGYTLALIAGCKAHAYGIERIGNLAQDARKRLDYLGFHEALIRCSDGKKGWPEYAPFDLIILSAAFNEVPSELFDQLANNGRLVAPLTLKTAQSSKLQQNLVIYERDHDRLKCYNEGECLFVRAS